QQRAQGHTLLVLIRQRELRCSPAHGQHACSPVRELLRLPASMIAAWRNAMLESRALRGAVAQLGERRVRNAKVEGSIPFRSTISLLFFRFFPPAEPPIRYLNSSAEESTSVFKPRQPRE